VNARPIEQRRRPRWEALRLTHRIKSSRSLNPIKLSSTQNDIVCISNDGQRKQIQLHAAVIANLTLSFEANGFQSYQQSGIVSNPTEIDSEEIVELPLDFPDTSLRIPDAGKCIFVWKCIFVCCSRFREPGRVLLFPESFFSSSSKYRQEL